MTILKSEDFILVFFRIRIANQFIILASIRVYPISDKSAIKFGGSLPCKVTIRENL